MYIVIRLNRFSLSILKKDPKRNYSGSRIFIFYTKVFINTFKKYSIYKNANADIIYKNSKKEIYFFRNAVQVKFFEYKTEKRYRFLIDNDILTDIKYHSGYFDLPLYFNNEHHSLTANPYLKLDLIKDTLLKLISIRIIKNEKYIEKTRTRLKELKITGDDLLILNEYESLNDKIPIYKSFVHGDLWSGNIIVSGNEVTIIDWDDLTFRSFTYDLFYYYFQLNNAILKDFINNYSDIQQNLLPLILYFSKRANIPFTEADYPLYFKLFIMERMIKRYDKRIY